MEVVNVTYKSSFWDFKGRADFIDQWFLMGSPFPLLLILTSYLLFVLKLGPEFMKTRPPYKLKRTLMYYNAVQVVYSCYLVCYCLRTILREGLTEKTCLMDTEYKKYEITAGYHYYLIAKVTELLDTVFFVLRKKWKQISFLHVYHHAYMLVATWIILKYEPTYSLAFLGAINSFVHVVMYSYYGLSAFPRLRKYLWWKKYLTKLQLIQFCLILVNVTLNFVQSQCPPSYFLLSLCWAHGILFIYLFTDFYLKNYKNNRNAARNCARVNDHNKKSNM